MNLLTFDITLIGLHSYSDSHRSITLSGDKKSSNCFDSMKFIKSRIIHEKSLAFPHMLNVKV